MWILDDQRVEITNIDNYDCVTISYDTGDDGRPYGVAAYKDRNDKYSDENEWLLGTYEEEERAEQIVRDIFKHIHMGDKVYEMPIE